jgi:hypothetical protein
VAIASPVRPRRRLGAATRLVLTGVPTAKPMEMGRGRCRWGAPQRPRCRSPNQIECRPRQLLVGRPPNSIRCRCSGCRLSRFYSGLAETHMAREALDSGEKSPPMLASANRERLVPPVMNAHTPSAWLGLGDLEGFLRTIPKCSEPRRQRPRFHQDQGPKTRRSIHPARDGSGVVDGPSTGLIAPYCCNAT